MRETCITVPVPVMSPVTVTIDEVVRVIEVLKAKGFVIGADDHCGGYLERDEERILSALFGD